MKSKIAWLWAVIFSCLTCCVSGTQFKEKEKPDDVVFRIENTVVELVELIPSVETYCGGVWISSDLILTANHCTVKDVNPILSVFGLLSADDTYLVRSRNVEGLLNSDILEAKLVARDESKDLAVLKVKKTVPHSFALISVERDYDSEKIHIIGHPAGLSYTYLPGVVSKVRNVKDEVRDVKTLQVFSGVWMGNSGGGAYNEAGELIGICSFVNSGAKNISFFIHHEDIRKFLLASGIWSKI